MQDHQFYVWRSGWAVDRRGYVAVTDHPPTDPAAEIVLRTSSRIMAVHQMIDECYGLDALSHVRHGCPLCTYTVDKSKGSIMTSDNSSGRKCLYTNPAFEKRVDGKTSFYVVLMVENQHGLYRWNDGWPTAEAAKAYVDEYNGNLGLSEDDVLEIIASSLGAKNQEPREFKLLVTIPAEAGYTKLTDVVEIVVGILGDWYSGTVDTDTIKVEPFIESEEESKHPLDFGPDVPDLDADATKAGK